MEKKLVVWIDPDDETSGIFEVSEKVGDVYYLKNEHSEAEAFEDEIQSLEDTYCCPQCGNIDIQEQGWFYVNSGTSRIVDMVENAPIWCDKCDGVISSGSVTCDVYLKNKNN